MKKSFRPHCGGYILLYVLVVIGLTDAIYTLVRQLNGTLPELMGSFSFFSYLIAVAAIAFARMYITSQVTFEGEAMRIVWPASIRPAPGAKRASIIFRQGELDLHQIDKTIQLPGLRRFGYVEDLGFERVDRSGGKPETKMFPVHEVAFLTEERKRYHLNIAVYSKEQQKGILEAIHAATGLTATGKLAELAPELESRVSYDDFVFTLPKEEPKEEPAPSKEEKPAPKAATEPQRPPRDDDVI